MEAKKINSYIMRVKSPSIYTHSPLTGRDGWISVWSCGWSKVYCFEGNLPEYVKKEMAKIAEKRGYKYYWNFGTYKERYD
jgi:hypothetical protein